MVQIKKLALAVIAASSLGAGAAHALGVGEVRLKSALNEPLRAEIQLHDLKGLTSQQVTVSLAPQKAYAEAGVERSYLVNGLRFQPVLQGNSGYILVTSRQPVREPYLDFLISVKWPTGLVTREFTVLLDPPNYTPASAYAAPRVPTVRPAPGRPALHPASASAYEAPPRRQGASAAPRRAVAKRSSGAVAKRPAQKADLGGNYRTRSNDTLWEIAARAGGRASIHQTMLAIQDLNPEAFVGGNINRLKVGQVLRLPNQQQIRSRSLQEAVAQVSVQTSAWKNPSLGKSEADRQLDARRRETAVPAATEKDATADRLKIAAGESGAAKGTQEGSGAGAGAGGDQALADKLAAAEENLDASRREKEELSSRVDSLQGQLEKLTKVVQLRDERLAAAQQGKAAGQQPAATAGADQDQAQQAPQPAKTEPPTDTAKAAEEGQASGQAEDSSVTPKTPEKPEVAEADSPAKGPEAAKPQSRPEQGLAQNKVVNEVGTGQAGSSWLLWLGIGIAVLLVLWLLSLLGRSSKRKSQQSAAIQPRPELSSPKPAAAAVSKPEPEPAKPAPVIDPVQQAETLLLNERYNEAIEVLQKGLRQEPRRKELHLKLLEVFAETGDKQAFESQAKALLQAGGKEQDVDLLKSYYPGLFAVAEPTPQAPVTDQQSKLVEAGEEEAAAEQQVFEPGHEEAAPELGEVEWTFDQPKADEGFDLNLEEGEAHSGAAQPIDDSLAGVESELVKHELEAEEESSKSNDELDELAALDEFLQSSQTPEEKGEEDQAGSEAPVAFQPAVEPPVAPAEPREEAAAPQELKPSSASPAPKGNAPAESIDGNLDEFEFIAGADEVSTKLDLARAYIEMGDSEGAQEVLNEVLLEGDEAQQGEARELIAKIG